MKWIIGIIAFVLGTMLIGKVIEYYEYGDGYGCDDGGEYYDYDDDDVVDDD